MDLQSKLRRLLPQQTSTPAPARKKIVKLEPFLTGQEIHTPYGPCYVMEKQLPLGDDHGHWSLRDVAKAKYEPNILASFRLEQALFLDTETTGLAGGTGTYAFLVGLGFFTANHFVLKQLLMRDYNEELALLYVLDQELRRKNTIISFNGKTFDLPLLQTRFTISRLDLPGIETKEHVDLLHLSRRLWRHKLQSCSLGSLEANILGVTRHDDIPGFEIPGRYFEFLQTGDGSLLQDIVAHNQIDIVSMATLLYRLQVTLQLEPDECDCPFEAEALANLALRDRKQRMALDYLEAAKQLAWDDAHYLRILRQTGAIFKRLGEYQKAAVLWKKILELSATDLGTAEELAKYYEHKLKDVTSAQQVTRRALALALQSRSPKIPALEHRLKRLDSKLARASMTASPN